ncbi:MAG: SDR family NAD(P)-dependent oxidoreductase [Propionibacteriales bacterium]|nr:SDR family NAD(P)-dependent oxidoreductase [Propionibacteriales bacterium]
MRIDGSSAVVTGGASGLGLATAGRLVADGAHVVIVDLPSSEGDVVAKRLGEHTRFAPADVRAPDQISHALDVAEESGPLRVAVHCAGIATPQRILDREGNPADLELYENVIQVNLIGTYNLLRLTAARMARNEPVDGDRGVIVMTASVAAFEGQIGQGPYASSKAGVHGLTLVAARDLADKAIRVCSIAPGLFDTPMLASLPQEARDSLGAMVPHPRRLGSPEEYAALAAHIVENPMLNGETVRLDGAIRMAPR